MEARVFSTLGDTGLDECRWNALAARGDTRSIFQTYQWTRSWLAAYGDEHEAVFVTAFGPGSVAGIAPLVVRRSSQRRRVLRFLGDGRADYCDFLTGGNKAKALSSLLSAALEAVPWDVVELGNLPARSRSVQMVQDICRRMGYSTLAEHQHPCPTLLVAGHEHVARRIANKPSLRRAVNRFARDGSLVFRHLKTMTEIEPYLEVFFDQHVERWAGSSSPSLFLDERNRVFYRELAASLAGKGWILFSVVEFNGEPVAFHYGFDYDGAVLWYKPSFSLAYASRSPGLVMVRGLIEYAMDHGRREFDFTVGDEPFKKRFTNASFATVRLRIFRDPVRLALARSVRLMARVARQFPSLKRLARNGGNGRRR